MNVLVLVKPVADIDSVAFHSDLTIHREKTRHSFDMADAHALATGRRLKGQTGGTLTVMSMAGAAQASLLENLKAYDMDLLVHIRDAAFAGSDTLATSRILARAITVLQDRGRPFDVVLCGRRSADGETGQVPSEVAAFLRLPCVTNVTHVDDVARANKEASGIDMTDEALSDHLVCTRLLEDQVQQLDCHLPCVVSLCSKGLVMETPSLIGLRIARQVPTVWLTNRELALDRADIGLAGSPTRVVTCLVNTFDRRKARWIFDPLEGAKAIQQVIQEALSSSPQLPQLSSFPELLPFPQLPPQTANSGDQSGGILSAIGDRDRGDYVVYPLFDPVGAATALEIAEYLAGQHVQITTVFLGKTLPDAVVKQFLIFGVRHFLHIPEESVDDRVYAQAIVQGLPKDANTVLLGASVRMRAIAPLCAVAFNTGLTADCTGLQMTADGRLIQIRPAFGGSLEAWIETSRRPQMATVRPHAFVSHGFPGAGVEALASVIPTECAQTALIPPGPVLVGCHAMDSPADEGQAIYFSVGNGVQEPALRGRIMGFGFCRGASRTAVNAFNLNYGWQIGQTGKLVNPRVYVGFGISGAIQHIVGIRQAKTIIAVNTDRKAPIFDYADIAICCDAGAVVTQLELLMDRVVSKGGIQ